MNLIDYDPRNRLLPNRYEFQPLFNSSSLDHIVEWMYENQDAFTRYFAREYPGDAPYPTLLGIEIEEIYRGYLSWRGSTKLIFRIERDRINWNFYSQKYLSLMQFTDVNTTSLITYNGRVSHTLFFTARDDDYATLAVYCRLGGAFPVDNPAKRGETSLWTR